MKTKERILEAALHMFAERGYAGTNLRDLAQSLGLSKSALYRHFASKEDIWNSLINSMGTYYFEERATAGNLAKLPNTIEQFKEMTHNLFYFTTHDERIVLIRRLLTIEQFRNEQTAHLATEYFFESPLRLYEKVFTHMMECGALQKGNPTMLAFAYITPISALLQLLDREPQKESWVFEQLDIFVNHFVASYGCKAQ